MTKCLLYYKIWKFHILIVGSSSINTRWTNCLLLCRKILIFTSHSIQTETFIFTAFYLFLRYENTFWKKKVPRFHASSRANQNALKLFQSQIYIYFSGEERTTNVNVANYSNYRVYTSIYEFHENYNTVIENYSFVKTLLTLEHYQDDQNDWFIIFVIL